jgi:membrane protein implicated in regulation of membrane protease activity
MGRRLLLSGCAATGYLVYRLLAVEVVVMNIFKFVLTLIVIVLAVFLGLALIGVVISALQYLFWFGVIALAAFIAIKLFKPKGTPRLEGRQSPHELHGATDTLQRTEQVLAEYKRKYLPK